MTTKTDVAVRTRKLAAKVMGFFKAPDDLTVS